MARQNMRAGSQTLAVLAMVLAMAGAAAHADEYVVEARTIPELKAVFGRVESRDVVAARARIGGTIRDIRVDEGSQVEAGAVIAVVVDDKIALQREAAEAEINALQSQLDNARVDLDRAQQLLARGTATQARVDQATTQVGVLSSQLAAAAARRAVIAQQSAEGEVDAPASGRVLTVPVTAGSVILPGETLATIAGGGYFLRLALPERHAAEIVEGDTVLVGRRALVDTDPTELPSASQGTLVKVYPEIDNGRVLADVEVEGLGDYFVGERTRVWIPVGHRSAIVVPVEAVTTRHGVDYVRIVGDGGEIEVAVILGETLAEDDGLKIEVLTGLHEGDRVVNQ
jgi:RND family efflux transporter MFP subunit